jgi:hypothetical protein
MTSTPTSPATLLEAVNALLRTIRVEPIASLSTIHANVDAADAKAALDDVSRELQTSGWNFNRERDYVIDPEVSGEVLLPANTLKVKTSRTDLNDRLVARGLRLYNPATHSYNIGRAAIVDIVIALPYEELPANAKAYVVALAARRFGIPKMPTGAVFNYTQEMVTTAMASLEQEDTEVEDTNLKQTSPHFQRMSRR